jgi:hypothetical protein
MKEYIKTHFNKLEGILFGLSITRFVISSWIGTFFYLTKHKT